MIDIKFMKSNEDILLCFDLMKSLRLTLNNPLAFLEKVKSQQNKGYQLLALINNESIVSIAGYRYVENFIHGEFIYVDDLITNSELRGNEFGSTLFNAIVDQAKQKQIDYVVLDSGISNTLAHRFYYRQGMLNKALHFTLDLKNAA